MEWKDNLNEASFIFKTQYENKEHMTDIYNRL